MYAGFLCLETALIPEGAAERDLVALSIWVIFLAIAVGAVHALKRRTSTSPSS
jgi:hypothetical protein